MITMVRCSGALALCVALVSTAWGGSVPTPAKRPAAAPAQGQAHAQAQASCNRGQFRIVIDVGHTADSPGAVSARGVNEYDFNKRLATRD